MNANDEFLKQTHVTEEEYKNWIDECAGYLCGFSCGTAVDIILEYTTRPDLSKRQFERLVSELLQLQEKWYGKQ